MTRVTAILSLALPLAAQVNFDNFKPGAAPPNWTAAGPAKVEVRREATAPSRPNVFGIAGAGGGGPLLYDKVSCADGDLTVKFRIVPKGPDQTAGIVFRYKDPGNYFRLTVSADRRNIALVQVTNGKAETIGIKGQHNSDGVAHDLAPGQWYLAKVIFRGDRVRVLLGNRRLFEVQDPRLRGSGKTGVWTSGHTEAWFDDFRIDRRG